MAKAHTRIREKCQEGKQESGCHKHGQTSGKMSRMGSLYSVLSVPISLFSESLRNSMVT